MYASLVFPELRHLPGVTSALGDSGLGLQSMSTMPQVDALALRVLNILCMGLLTPFSLEVLVSANWHFPLENKKKKTLGEKTPFWPYLASQQGNGGTERQK